MIGVEGGLAMAGQGSGGRPPRRWPWVAAGSAGTLVVLALLAAVLGWFPAGLPGQGPGGPLAPGAQAGSTLLDAGSYHTCQVDPEGLVSCWGSNDSGQLGLAARTPRQDEPATVPGLGRVTAVSAGDNHTCVVDAEGAVHCWGANWAGQLGDGTKVSSSVPVPVRGLGSGVVAVSAGSGSTCALTVSGAALCWGDNNSGQLGDGNAPGYREGVLVSGTEHGTAPVAVTGLDSGVKALTVGGNHACAITAGDTVACWGANQWGQLGHGEAPVYDAVNGLVAGVERSAVPVEVPGLADVVALSAGSDFVCALTASGAGWCWGGNYSSQLGQPAPTYDPVGGLVAGVEQSAAPVEVPGLGGAVALAAGMDSVCALDRQGEPRCWGANSGQFGTGTQPRYDPDGVLLSGVERSVAPVVVEGATQRLRTLSVGVQHACGVSATGEVACWGQNWAGQLGNPSAPDTGAPTAVHRSPPAQPTPRQVDLRLIVLDSALDVATDVPRDERVATAGVFGRLLERDPALLDAVRRGVGAATYGRLDPRLDVVVADELVKPPGSCLDVDGDAERVENLARPYAREGAINVVVVKAKLCRGEQTFGGYDGGGMPVVGWVSLGSVQELVHTLVHEYGHDRGLLHAGWANCEDRVGIATCTTDETGDPASVMSYGRSSDVFTGPELATLGLLTPDEVVGPEPASGEYHLVDPWEVGTKSVQLQRGLNGDGNPFSVYFSHTHGQIEVRFTKSYSGASVYGREQSQQSLALLARETTTPGDELFRRGDVTVTYVGRDADGNSVIRITRAGDLPPSPAPAPGAQSAGVPASTGRSPSTSR